MDLLACPACSGPVRERPGKPACGHCRKEYPLVRGIPVMTMDGTFEEASSPPLRDGYEPWIHRRTMSTLLGVPGNRPAVLDLGSGNIRLDLPRLIRMDASLASSAVWTCLAGREWNA